MKKEITVENIEILDDEDSVFVEVKREDIIISSDHDSKSFNHVQVKRD